MNKDQYEKAIKSTSDYTNVFELHDELESLRLFKKSVNSLVDETKKKLKDHTTSGSIDIAKMGMILCDAFFTLDQIKQEPLGKDFEKVLNDNLWDLYGS